MAPHRQTATSSSSSGNHDDLDLPFPASWTEAEAHPLAIDEEVLHPDADDSSTDLARRARSDTLCTFSSSASSTSYPFLRTPPTPGILTQLISGNSVHHPDGSQHEVGFYGDKDRGASLDRRLSYGFGQVLDLPAGQLTPAYPGGSTSRTRTETPVAEGGLSAEDVAAGEASIGLGRDDDPGPELRLPATVQTIQDERILAPSTPGFATPSSHRPKTSFTNAIRNKLDRSRTSLRSLGKVPAVEALPQAPGVDVDSPAEGSTSSRPRLDKRRHSSKLKDLFTRSRSRSASTLSLNLSLASARSTRTDSAAGVEGSNAVLRAGDAERSRSSSLVSMGSITASSIDDDPLRSAHPACVQTHDTAHSAEPEDTAQILFPQAARVEGTILVRDYAHAIPLRPAPTVRPERALSAGVLSFPPRPEADELAVSSSVVMKQRALSMPFIETPRPSAREKGKARARSIDLFNTMLPREIQLLVFRALISPYAPASTRHPHPLGRSRWTGLSGAHKQLILLSRVSRAWQSLAFDPQLWSSVDLTRAGPFLHPRTVNRILRASASGIKSLSLRGLNGLGGGGILEALGECAIAFPHSPHDRAYTAPLLPSLTHLDLRHTSLPTPVLLGLLDGAPHLTHLNLSGTPTASSLLLRALPATSPALQSLDVSRCWDLTLGDVHTWLALLPDGQAARIRELRVGGLKSYGRGAGEFLKVVGTRLDSLEKLSLQGCSAIQDGDIEGFAQAIRDRLSVPALHPDIDPSAPYRRPSALLVSSMRHLNISSCSRLSYASFSALTGLFPLLETFEAAALPEAFRETSSNVSPSASLAEGGEQVLCNFLKGCVRLRRLDLEGTGVRAGVGDRVLGSLTPPPPSARLRQVFVPEEGIEPREYNEGTIERFVGDELEELRIGHAKGVTPEGLQRLIAGCPKLRVLEADNTAANNAVMRAFVAAHGADPHASLNLVDCRSITPLAYSALAPTTRPRQALGGYEGVPFVYDAGITPVSSTSRLDRLHSAPPRSRSSGRTRPRLVPVYSPGGALGAFGSGMDFGDVDVDAEEEGEESAEAEEEEPLAGEYAPKPILKTFWSWRRVGVPKGWREELARAEREERMWGLGPASSSLLGRSSFHPAGRAGPDGVGRGGAGAAGNRGRKRAATLSEANGRAGKTGGGILRPRAGTHAGPGPGAATTTTTAVDPESRSRWWTRQASVSRMSGNEQMASGLERVGAAQLAGIEEFEPPQGGRCVVM